MSDNFEPEDLENSESWGRFPLDEDWNFSVELFQSQDALEPEEVNFDLRPLLDELEVERDQDFIFQQIVIEGVPDDYDYGSPDARGAYDKDEVLEFLNATGFWGISLVYYDEDTDSYYVDVNYEDN